MDLKMKEFGIKNPRVPSNSECDIIDTNNQMPIKPNNIITTGTNTSLDSFDEILETGRKYRAEHKKYENSQRTRTTSIPSDLPVFRYHKNITGKVNNLNLSFIKFYKAFI